MSFNPPSGIDERPEQLRPPIIKAEGFTQSERYLSSLAEKSFLNLWSYPSLFRNQRQHEKGDGKELCDLLVVCGDSIIIFSEKHIGWSSGDVNVAWRRWAKRAVRDAAKQAKGAERWITEFPNEIYLDRNCTVPFPINFPEATRRSIHRVIVTRGASEACRAQLVGSSGSFIIRPSIVGDAHWAEGCEPFAVGDLDPLSSFVHVFDEVGLDVVMAELDTIADFSNYLTRRAELIRSGNLVVAHGEENLLARYATRIGEDGDHAFFNVDESGPISVDRGLFADLVTHPQYIAKKAADKISYLWDELINGFTRSMLNGTSIVPEGYSFDLAKSELGVRHMALQSRFQRRTNGEAVRGALIIGQGRDGFTRTMIGEPNSKGCETGFFILTMKYLDWMEDRGGYENYRLNRAELAKSYANGLLEKYSHLERVIGISSEPPGQGRGVSEELIYAEQLNWSDNDRAQIKENCKQWGILQGQMKKTHWSQKEYPEVHLPDFFDFRPTEFTTGGGNRKSRRAANATARKKKK